MKTTRFSRSRSAAGNRHPATGFPCRRLLKKIALALCVWSLALAGSAAIAADKADSAKVPVPSIETTGTPGSPSATTTIPGNQLPAPDPKSGGVIKDDALSSKAWWAPRVVPPKKAPNILLIMTDDSGFGVPSTFGGVIPADTKLEPWPKDILKPWDQLTPEEQKLFTRQVEVFAAYAADNDYEMGRVVQAIEDMGKLDDTLIIYINGDNGTSAEGGPLGTPNEAV